jgi:hypothetical protein
LAFQVILQFVWYIAAPMSSLPPRPLLPSFKLGCAFAFASLLSVALAGCRCSKLSGEVDELAFTRCAQVAPPKERNVRTAQLELSVQERVLTIKAPAGLRVAAFTGPVGAPLSRGDVALLAAHKPGLIFLIGGIGDDVGAASANLAALSALHVPTVFIAGGADRLPVIEEAFDSLDADTSELMLHGSGLREVRLGKERLAVVSGSPLGRYAVDADGCGFALADLDEVREALSTGSKSARSWLLSWAAPSGFGLSSAAGVDVGSPELFALAQALSAQGGLFAYPETQVGLSVRDPKRTGEALVVPRLGRTGSSRADGGRLASSVRMLVLTQEGLASAP